jgi:NhaA family Na+:H+ antiporter
MVRIVPRRIVNPLVRFLHDSRSVGITLLACTLLSLLLANAGFWDEGYRNFWMDSFDGSVNHHFHLGLLSLPNSPLLIINDGLMAVFFMLAGMEIKRELISGELASVKKATLPILGAVGGMLAPALLFSLFNKGTGTLHGWAIPTATDIAFTLGIASLLGKRVPVSLKIFLTALAIIDDLGAILVIAFFYGGSLQLSYLAGCLIAALLLWLINRFTKTFNFLHILAGLLLWYMMFMSGIHATVAGVVFAFLLPVRYLSPLELQLHKPVYFVILPLFAMANTAIPVAAGSFSSLNSPLSWGIIAGLCIGKPLGICGAVYFMVKKKIAEMPRGVSMHAMAGGGFLAGIGFTMSIFISMLAFTDTLQQDTAKLSVLIASMLSMVLGYLVLRYAARYPSNP